MIAVIKLNNSLYSLFFIILRWKRCHKIEEDNPYDNAVDGKRDECMAANKTDKRFDGSKRENKGGDKGDDKHRPIVYHQFMTMF